MELFFNYGGGGRAPQGRLSWERWSRTGKIHFSNNKKSLMELTESVETPTFVQKNVRSCNGVKTSEKKDEEKLYCKTAKIIV